MINEAQQNLENLRAEIQKENQSLLNKFKSEFLYDGEQLKNGIEEKKYFDDSLFIGMIKNGKREGKGLYTYKHGDYYFGSW
jgi:hypothetical protein